MAAILGDLIQIVDVQQMALQQVLNVYYYRVTSVTGINDSGYEAVAEWFWDNIMNPLREIQSTAVTHLGIEVRNLSNNLDFYVENFDGVLTTGAVSGDSLPPYVSYGFKLNRESLATRNGYKRFAGVPEAHGANASYTPSTEDIALLEAGLAADIVAGLVTLAEPVIVRRPIEPPVGTLYTYASIGSATFRGIGSQNTRKVGRGS